MDIISIYLTFAPGWWKTAMTVLGIFAWLLVLYIWLAAVSALVGRLTDKICSDKRGELVNRWIRAVIRDR